MPPCDEACCPEEVRCLDACVLAHASDTPGAVALVDTDGATTYRELAADVARLAGALERLGIEPGDRVAMLASKRTATVACLLGAQRLGAIAVPINPLLKPAQVVHVLADSGARILFASGRALARLAGALSESSGPVSGCESGRESGLELELLVADDDDVTGQPVDRLRRIATITRRALTDGAVPRERDASATATPRDAPAAILYTSGSTARPKGVVLSEANLAHGAASVASYLRLGPADRLLALMPLGFDYGLNQVTSALTVGARAVLFDPLLPKGIVDAVVEHRVTGLPGVPHLWNRLALLDWPPVEHLRYLTNTGGRMPVATTRRLARALPATDIVLMYGFTEAFRSTWLPPRHALYRPDSIGVAVPHARVLVVAPDGRECDAGETGELIHGGPLVAAGYWRDEAATRAKFRPRFAPGVGAPEVDANGEDPTGRDRSERFAWSGDLARRDEDGFLYFVSRREDLVKLYGYRVNPAEIEEAIMRSPDVRDACVICVPHATLGQAALAVVVADVGAGDAIEAHCRAELPAYMVPGRVVIVAALPSGPNGKVDRQALHSTYDEQ